MRLQVVRAVVAVAIIALAVMTPMLWDSGSRLFGDPRWFVESFLNRHPDAVVFAQGTDDDGGDDNDDADNDEDDDNDDDDDDGDNDADDYVGDTEESDEDFDNVSAPVPPSGPAGVPPAAAPPASASPTAPAGSETQASGTSTGGDSTIALSGDRVVVQVSPSMPAGLTITIRLVDPAPVPPPPGTRAGNQIFRIEAQDASGTPLTALPAEVILAVRYTDQEVAGLNEQQATLSWLDPADTRWKPAPKLATDPSTNYVAASVTALGTYALSVP